MELPAEVERQLAAGTPYVIRQKMPLVGSTTYRDLILGSITIENSELEDQILLKSDGMPTYNFANVIDDHLMRVSHIIRGTEFITSTPKHVLLYEAFGWEAPVFVHLAPVMGRDDATGKTSKLSKRHGAASFGQLLDEGYLAEAVTNYVALLGWSPKDTNQEIFTMEELIGAFSLDGISKSPAIFDYKKLDWMNGEYFKAMAPEEFYRRGEKYLKEYVTKPLDLKKIAEMVRTRVETFLDIREMVDFFNAVPAYETELFVNKKSKSTADSSASSSPASTSRASPSTCATTRTCASKCAWGPTARTTPSTRGASCTPSTPCTRSRTTA